MLSNIYFMHLADNLQTRIVEKIKKEIDLNFMGTYDLLDSQQSLLDPTSVFLCRLDISNLILKGCLRN